MPGIVPDRGDILQQLKQDGAARQPPGGYELLRYDGSRIEVHIHLREWNADPGLVERVLGRPRDPLPNVPILLGSAPDTKLPVDAGLAQLGQEHPSRTGTVVPFQKPG